MCDVGILQFLLDGELRADYLLRNIDAIMNTVLIVRVCYV
jgi:hypothetical protein